MCPLAKVHRVTTKRRLQTSLGWLPAFKKAYSESRFRDASAIYDAHATGSESIESMLLGARAHLRFDPSGTIRLLIDLATPRQMKREVGERDMLLGEAFARTDAFEDADERLESALNIARRLSDHGLESEVGYRLVRRYIRAGDAGTARQFLPVVRRGKSLAARLNAIHAEAFVLDLEERVQDEARLLTELLRLINPDSFEHMHHRAWGTEALAMLARDLFIPQAVPEIQRQLHGVPWASDFQSNRFQTEKALGWTKAMQGDYLNAFRHLKSASVEANSDAWRVVAACDRSYLARCLGEQRWSRQELDEAEQLALRVNWHATLGEERAGLLLLAELFSSFDPATSSMYLGKYRELGDVKSSLHNRRDARTLAYLRFSTAVVELALGSKRGLNAIRDAGKTFERFGYDFRVARCLIADYRATANEQLVPRIREKLRNYGQSWLASEFRKLEEPGDRVGLPPMQRRVFDQVLQGKTTEQIAQALGKSKFTIANHLREVFKAFNVNSRSALIAEAIKRGLVAGF